MKITREVVLAQFKVGGSMNLVDLLGKFAAEHVNEVRRQALELLATGKLATDDFDRLTRPGPSESSARGRLWCAILEYGRHRFGEKGNADEAKKARDAIDQAIEDLYFHPESEEDAEGAKCPGCPGTMKFHHMSCSVGGRKAKGGLTIPMTTKKRK